MPKGKFPCTFCDEVCSGEDCPAAKNISEFLKQIKDERKQKRAYKEYLKLKGEGSISIDN